MYLDVRLRQILAGRNRYFLSEWKYPSLHCGTIINLVLGSFCIASRCGEIYGIIFSTGLI
ncbi:hypothetical protein DRQ29_00945 [bacterium]|nr:MAG: hypothetical protein DRQ29_00945 [bacterium]